MYDIRVGGLPTRILQEFQNVVGVNFNNSRSFGLSALLLRGLRKEGTREATEQVFKTLVGIGMQLAASTGMAPMEADLTGYFCVLWTSNESARAEVRYLFTTFDPEELANNAKSLRSESVTTRKRRSAILNPNSTFFRKVFGCQGFASSHAAILSLALFLYVLQTHTLTEDQVMAIYRCFLEAADILPDAFLYM